MTNDEILHVLRELERLELIVERLCARNIVKPIDVAIVEVHQQMTHASCLAVLAETNRDDEEAAIWNAKVAETSARLRRLEEAAALEL